LPRPKRAEILKPFHKEIRSLKGDEIISTADYFWKKEEREFQYIALNILEMTKKNWEEKFFENFSYLITDNSWWDTVDMIASHLIGGVYKLNPRKFRKEIIKFSKAENIWQVRTSIIFQLNYGKETDTELLFEVIRWNKSKEEFFIQKGIGWALRQLTYTDAGLVKKFVKENELSKLATREALRRLK